MPTRVVAGLHMAEECGRQPPNDWNLALSTCQQQMTCYPNNPFAVSCNHWAFIESALLWLPSKFPDCLLHQLDDSQRRFKSLTDRPDCQAVWLPGSLRYCILDCSFARLCELFRDNKVVNRPWRLVILEKGPNSHAWRKLQLAYCNYKTNTVSFKNITL